MIDNQNLSTYGERGSKPTLSIRSSTQGTTLSTSDWKVTMGITNTLPQYLSATNKLFHVILNPDGKQGPSGTLGPMASDDDLQRARDLLAHPRRVTVLTGAGISTDSGIPDFRGPRGVWTRNPAAERASTLSHYLKDGQVRRQAWQSRLHSPAWEA